MRRLLVLAVVLGALIPSTAQAAELIVVEKRATADVPAETWSNGSFGDVRGLVMREWRELDSGESDRELEFLWDGAMNDQAGDRVWTGHISYEGNILADQVYHQRGVKGARLTFTDPFSCIWVDEDDVPGAVDGCIEGELLVRARWTAFGPIIRTRFSNDGGLMFVRDTRQASIEGAFTFDGERLPGSNFNGTGELIRTRTYTP